MTDQADDSAILERGETPAGQAVEILEPRIVNLTELAFVLNVSVPTLKRLMMHNPDFPIKNPGERGNSYEFDLDAVIAWQAAHDAELDEAKKARESQLELWRSENEGMEPPADGSWRLSPTERRAEAEAQFREDQLRQRRGELVELAQYEAKLTAGLLQLRKTMQSIAREYGRAQSLEREQIRALEATIDEKINEAVDRLADPEFYADIGAIGGARRDAA